MTVDGQGMKMARILMTMALALALCPAAFTQTATPAPAEQLTARVDQLFAQWDKPDSPGCALAVIKEGQIVYKRAYGTANLELAAPLTTSSVFNAGSISKQFTAISILMLAQQGKLSLDDKVQKYIPEVPDFGTPVTLRHLIYHTSGLRDFLEMLEMCAEVARSSVKSSRPVRPRWLTRAKELLSENFSEHMTLSDIAAAVGVHPVYLAGVFRQHYHCSIGEYVRRLRVEFASRQLSQTSAPIIEIALAAGFAHQSHFSRTFKRLTGLTPARYRAATRSS